MKIKKRKFGLLSDGTKISLYTVSNKCMSFSVTNYGCTVTSIMVPDRNGNLDDIALGFSTLEGFIMQNNVFFGVLVGRFANRIGNASFKLNGKTYKLDANDNGNCLHSGFNQFSNLVWKAKEVHSKEGTGVRFSRTIPDGFQGFPGNMYVEVTYLLTDTNDFSMIYRARTDADTPVSLTNHSYFNLRGEGKGTVLDHELTINADSILEVDKNLIPTGNFTKVSGTPYDFTKAKKMGADIDKTPFGYDHCYVLNGKEGELTECATVKDPVSGRCMKIKTNQAGVQFYSANSLSNKHGKNNVLYTPRSAFCLETQQFPDAPNKKDFPSCILKPGETYESITIHSFSNI